MPSANTADSGLKGLIERKFTLFWMWCLVNWIELAIKDTLNGSLFFELIDEMLLRLYYLYEQSPKKYKELEQIISDLKECHQFHLSNLSKLVDQGGQITKLTALKCVLSKYGACTPDFDII